MWRTATSAEPQDISCCVVAPVSSDVDNGSAADGDDIDDASSTANSDSCSGAIDRRPMDACMSWPQLLQESGSILKPLSWCPSSCDGSCKVVK